MGLEVAIVHVELTNKEFGIRFVTNCNKGACYSKVFSAAILFLDAHTSNAFFIAKNFVESGVQFQFHFAFRNFCHEAIIQDWFSAELIATMNDGYFFSNTGQVERFFNCSITTTDYTNILIAVEEAVASCATRNTTAHECFLTW